MIYNSSDIWKMCPNKSISLFGMSGVGKSFLSELLTKDKDWFHYSVDYQIANTYLQEMILEKLSEDRGSPSSNMKISKIELPKEYIHDTTLLSQYLGKPGSKEKGGIPFTEFVRRQKEHRIAEKKATNGALAIRKKVNLDAAFNHFVCDTSGSLCELVDPGNPNDRMLKTLSSFSLLIWIKGTNEMTEELVTRFIRSPKPMYYNINFLKEKWKTYCNKFSVEESFVDPDSFIIYGYRELIKHRLPIYQKIADNWGVTIDANIISSLRDSKDFVDLIGKALSTRK